MKSCTKRALMAARVSHMNDMIAARIDRTNRRPEMMRDLSVAQIAAIFAGAGTKQVVGIKFADDDGEGFGDVIPVTNDIRVNGLDFARGHAELVYGDAIPVPVVVRTEEEIYTDALSHLG